MKVVEKIKVSIFFLGLFSGCCAISILLLGFPRLWTAVRNANFDGPSFLILLALTGLMTGFLLTTWLFLRLIRLVLLPVRDAADFANRLAGGELPAQLPEKERANDEVNTLFSALNFLRDRQQNLASRLKLTVSHEADVRRNVTAFSALQLKILARMIPETGVPLGEIKGFSRILMLDLESEELDRAEMNRLLQEIGHRVGTISRQLERMVDIARFDRARGEQFEVTEFNTVDFLRELVAFNSITLREREIALVNHLSASAPKQLTLDRELLFQLMILLIRAIGRSASPGETLFLGCFQEEKKVVFEVRDSRNAPYREEIVENYNLHIEEGIALENASVQVLGMILARELAGKLGGELQVLSTESAHALLRLTLPESCATNHHHSRHSQQYAAFPALLSDKEPDLSLPLKVLYGTEVPEGPYIMRRLLGNFNLEFTCVDNADEVCRKMKEESFDCLILSGTLKAGIPAMIDELRQDRPDLPVMVIAGTLSTEEQRELHNMDRVYPMNTSLNFALLGRLIREAAAPQRQA